jgi:hypothetical protein
MPHQKNHFKTLSQMRAAKLIDELRAASQRARLKAETAFAVAAFNVRVLTPSPVAFYPTIGAAISARRCFLVCECPGCGQLGGIDLRKLDRHRGASIESLIPLLSCRQCRPNAPFARIIGLRKRP